MLCHGDEYGRTQKGNNNAYCQDSELTWMHWDWDSHAQQLSEFASRLIHYRKEHPIFRRPKFFPGEKDPRLGNQGCHVVQPRRHGR